MTKEDLLKELQVSPEILDDDNNKPKFQVAPHSTSNSSSSEGLVSYGMNT